VNLEEPGDVAGQAAGDERDESHWDMNYVPKKPQSKLIEVALSNSFGFGGTCATLCFRKYHT
jgi:3-oxoacyl-[acyl-carrier-protein] synthase II